MNERKRRILFIDRDGTLIVEPPDEQVDSLEKLQFVPGVVRALQDLAAAGYEFVIVSNQDGLGTDSFPVDDFTGPQNKMLELLASQGIQFSDILIDPHFEHDDSPNRKPGIGMVLDYLKSGELDLADSWVIGDRETDLELARNMGIGGLRLLHRLVRERRAVSVIGRPPNEALGDVERVTVRSEPIDDLADRGHDLLRRDSVGEGQHPVVGLEDPAAGHHELDLGAVRRVGRRDRRPRRRRPCG